MCSARAVQRFPPMLMAQWTNRTVFLSNDSMFCTIDKMCLEFMLIVEGMEYNSDYADKLHNALHVPAPLLEGGLGGRPQHNAHALRA